jgi:glycosyltransferase involved in cell wall biosynthesis
MEAKSGENNLKGEKLKKVLYVIGQLDWGGAERQLLYLIKGLDRERYRPFLCVLSTSLGMLPLYQAEDIPVFRFKRFLPRLDISRFFRLAALIKKTQPDLIHSYLLPANIYSCLAGRISGVPVIISERNFDPFKFGGGTNFDRYLERLISPLASALIANSKAGAVQVSRRTGIPQEKIYVVYNGIELDRVKSCQDHKIRLELGLSDALPVIGIVGSLVGKRKDHATFLQAMKLLSTYYLGDVRIICVGTGPKFKETVSLAKELGLNDRIIFTGFRPDVPDIMMVLDLLVSSSQREGMPNVVMEAMAAGKPVVATAVGGTPELVVHEETGLLVSPRDPQALAASVHQILADPERSRRMGKAGRQRIEQHFTLERMVTKTETIYEQILLAS